MKMRILVVNYLLSPYRVDWLDALGKEADVTILSVVESDNEREPEWLEKKPQNCKHILMRGITIPKIGKVSFDFIKEVKKNDYDIILLDGYGYIGQLINILFLNMRRKDYFVNIDGIVPKNQENRLLFRLKKSLIQRFPYCLCGCKASNSTLEKYGVARCRIINHPFTSLFEKDIVPTVPSADEKTELRNKLGISEKNVVISVGRFTYLNGYGKGYDVLLRSASKLPKDIGWYIVGGAPTEEFKKMTQEKGLTNVHYIDFLSKEALKEYYKAADLFVLMTVGDAWGLVINEAMACGLPVITTDKCMAGVDLIRDGENGYIIPVGDDGALCERAREILSSPAQRERMGKNALAAIAPYTIENMADTHLNAMKRILSDG